MRIGHHILQAIRYAASQPCHRSNCGTVCKCGPCHARAAISTVERQEQRRSKLRQKKAREQRGLS